MTEHVWADTYTRAVHAFDGQTPSRQLEATLIERFETNPAAVDAAIDKLAARYHEGKIHSPWGLILGELDDIDRTKIRTDGKAERETAIRLAQTWIRNAGLYAPLDEAQRELFDQRGHLHPWADDEALKIEVAEFWREQQPRADQAERERLERAERWKQAQTRLT